MEYYLTKELCDTKDSKGNIIPGLLRCSREGLRRLIRDRGFPRPIYLGLHGRSKALYPKDLVHAWLRRRAELAAAE